MTNQNKIQAVSFLSLEAFFSSLPDNEKKIVELLRHIILECIPDCKEKLTYNIPYYYKTRRICFLWPVSVPWGGTPLNGVMLGFCCGNLMSDELNYFEKGNRK